MQGIGAYEKTLHFLGRLDNTQLVKGAEFIVSPPAVPLHNYLSFCGNRVNLYLFDGITTVTRQIPGLKLGIYVAWGFRANTPTQNRVDYRDIDWGTAGPQVPDPFLTGVAWHEPKMVFNESSPGSGLQLAELQSHVFKLPVNDTNLGSTADPNHCRVIPIEARSDFMRVFFWCDPTPFVTQPADRILLWAMGGSDVAGSQRI